MKPTEGDYKEAIRLLSDGIMKLAKIAVQAPPTQVNRQLVEEAELLFKQAKQTVLTK